MPLLSKSDELIFPSSYFAALSRLRCVVRLPNGMWLHARHGVGAFKMFARSDEAGMGEGEPSLSCLRFASACFKACQLEASTKVDTIL